jgi:hypothetical protein
VIEGKLRQALPSGGVFAFSLQMFFRELSQRLAEFLRAFTLDT